MTRMRTVTEFWCAFCGDLFILIVRVDLVFSVLFNIFPNSFSTSEKRCALSDRAFLSKSNESQMFDYFKSSKTQ